MVAVTKSEFPIRDKFFRSEICESELARSIGSYIGSAVDIRAICRSVIYDRRMTLCPSERIKGHVRKFCRILKGEADKRFEETFQQMRQTYSSEYGMIAKALQFRDDRLLIRVTGQPSLRFYWIHKTFRTIASNFSDGADIQFDLKMLKYWLSHIDPNWRKYALDKVLQVTKDGVQPQIAEYAEALLKELNTPV